MNNNSKSLAITSPSNFKFSAVRPDDLGATEYTLVTIVVDVSTSVYDFADELKATVQAIINASAKSPRADNLLVRLTSFNSKLQEEFGFRTLQDLQAADVQDFQPDGFTALFDASLEALEATEQYGQLLYDQDFDTNGAVYVITDGWDNHSRKATAKSIAKKLCSIRNDEKLESIFTMLIGLNTMEDQVATSLQDFTQQAKFDQYVDVGDATASNLAKLAGFISQSITSQSQALGTGAPSQVLSF